MRLEKEIKQKEFNSVKEKAVVNILYTGNRITEESLLILKDHDLNDQHYNILRILKGRYPDCTCPGEIKEVLMNKRGDLTRLLDKLERLGLVRRWMNPENRRMMNVAIEEKGINELNAINKKMKKLDLFSDRISDKEADELNRILDKLRG